MTDNITYCIDYINSSIIILVFNISNISNISNIHLTKSINDLIYANNTYINNDTLHINNETLSTNNDTNNNDKYYEFFIVMFTLCIIGLMGILYIICSGICSKLLYSRGVCNIKPKIYPAFEHNIL
jgi:hypothetical protein